MLASQKDQLGSNVPLEAPVAQGVSMHQRDKVYMKGQQLLTWGAASSPPACFPCLAAADMNLTMST